MSIITICLVISATIWAVSFLVAKSPRKVGKLPPGPYAWPIIGNLFQIGRNPHRSLAKLSKIYGPLMSFKVGCCNMVVVSSADIAKEMFTKHDLSMSGRFVPIASEVCDHDKYCFGILPVGNHWRKCRKICKEQAFSTSKLVAGQGLRQAKLQQLYEHVTECCKSGQAVNIEEVVFTTTLNLMSATMFSFELGDYGSDSIRELKGALMDVFNTIGAPNLADYFPILKGTDLQGLKRQGELSLGKLLAILEDVIQQRLSSSSSKDSPRKHDMLESLLDPKTGKDYDLSTNDIKHLLVDLLIGGADTMSGAIVWGMTELMRNPKKTAILKQELRTVLGKNKQIEESDIPRLPYLQAVIKEVLRYHPPGPLLLPHKVEADIHVRGYTIPKETQIVTNVWCMGRDPNIWENPDSFEPERFLNSNIDYGGHHFELIPFGSGRRMCPGMPLADRMLHLIVGFFIHNFDWQLEAGEKLDFTEKFGVTLRKSVPLKAVPSISV